MEFCSPVGGDLRSAGFMAWMFLIGTPRRDFDKVFFARNGFLMRMVPYDTLKSSTQMFGLGLMTSLTSNLTCFTKH